MIRRYLNKFRLEEDDFNEDEDQDWVALKESVRCPNLRALMIKFLHQVRESKGYDVDIPFAFVTSPFYPCSLDNEVEYSLGKEAAEYAIVEINMETMPGGKIYKLISLDKFVMAHYRKMLITFTAEEIDINSMDIDDADDDDKDLKTIRAMLFQPYVRSEPHIMFEWKFKLESPSNVGRLIQQ